MTPTDSPRAAQPLSEEDIANVREVLDSQLQLGHDLTLMPTDVLERLLNAATLDARELDVERLAEARVEGAKALFLELIAADSGGFIPAERGIRDKDGNAEDWIAIGWVFASFQKVEAALRAALSETNHD